MLIKYKKSYEKIAMGLLSFMLGQRELKTLQKTIETYENNPDLQLYLWKIEEDFVGLIGIDINEDSFTILHVSVDPSHRSQGIGQVLIEKTQQLMAPRKMHATEETEAFLAKCLETRKE